MEIVIDTSVLIDIERGRIDVGELIKYKSIYMSSITVTELLVGAQWVQRASSRVKKLSFCEKVIDSISSLPFGLAEAKIYAQIMIELRSAGITIGIHDMLIGATAISNNLPILTLNTKDFKRIPGVEVIEV